MVGEGDIAALVRDADMAIGGDLVGLLVIDDIVGDQNAALIGDFDMTDRLYGLIVAVIDDLIGLQQNLTVRRGRGGGWGVCACED